MEKLIQYATKASFYDGPFGNGSPWVSAGMGYVIVSGDAVIVIDGGHGADAEDLLSLLEQTTGKTPAVDTWIITHPHPDHYGALFGIVEDDALRERVKVKRVVSYFPESFRSHDGESIEGAVAKLRRILERTGAEHVTPSVDEAITCGGAEIKFWYVPTDFESLSGPNELSLVFSVEENSKKIMFTGDTSRRNLELITARFGEKLRSNAVQLPHHGLCDTGHIGFYKAVAASTVMVPTSIAGERNMREGNYGDAPAANRYAEENAKRVYKSFDGTCEIVF